MMKKLLAGAIAFALTVAVGCEQKSPPGGPGAQNAPKNTTGGPAAANRDHATANRDHDRVAPGTPGTTGTAGTHTTGGTTARGQSGDDRDNTFRLEKPSTVELKQAESKNVVIKIDRGTTFRQPVKITFEGLPEGVMMEPATAEIPAGQSEARVNVKTTNKTPVGDATVNVTATPQTGKPVRMDMKIKVDKGGTTK